MFYSQFSVINSIYFEVNNPAKIPENKDLIILFSPEK